MPGAPGPARVALRSVLAVLAACQPFSPSTRLPVYIGRRVQDNKPGGQCVPSPVLASEVPINPKEMARRVSWERDIARKGSRLAVRREKFVIIYTSISTCAGPA